MIECQNAFALIQCCTLCVGQNIRDYKWYKVQTHVLKVCSVHSIHSLWKSKRMATYMQRMRNNNLEIRIAGSSCRAWLSFIQIQTCQYILANSFWVKLINAWDFCPVMTEVSENVPATSTHFQQFSKDFQTLPKMWEVVLTTFKRFWSYFKCQREIGSNFCHINHVLKNNSSGFVCEVWEIVLVDEWNQGLEISPQAWNSCIMC